MTNPIRKPIFFALLLVSFQQTQSQSMKQLPKATNDVPTHAVIAHRGTTYWAPEETEVAYRWARNI
jgi:glycerophosphoryl diester phosphodiesterase